MFRGRTPSFVKREVTDKEVKKEERWCETIRGSNMRVCHGLILFFLTLREGSTAFFENDLGVRTGTEGGKVTIVCTFNFSGRRKIFCRDRCEDGNILVETSGVSNRSGRYSIEYKEGNYPTTSPMIYVSITNLKKSDSGRYSCNLARDWSLDGSETFELRVKDAPSITKPNQTLRLLVAQTPSASPPSTAAPASDAPLYVRLVLVILIIVSSSAVLIFCRKKKKTSEPEDPHVELDYVNIPEGDQVYEEVGEEERRSRPPPVETSSV